MWGTRSPVRRCAQTRRFIPTDVGNSSSLWCTAPDIPVHPHGCGELVAYQFSLWADSGSSPRMWGTHKLIGGQILKKRFIPTDVGNSDDVFYFSYRGPVHPHGCGELELTGYFQKAGYGSSPRMWGTPIPTGTEVFTRRFIPTDVGNSGCCNGYAPVQPVHPHGCGELYIIGFIIAIAAGSSPRMWGTPRGVCLWCGE